MATFGKTDQGSQAGSFDGVRAMGGVLPATSGMTLDNVQLLMRGTGDARVALYSGGTADNPSGATLVADLGTVTAPGATEAWMPLAGASQALTSGAFIWLVFKNNSFAWTAFFETSSAAAGDWQTERANYSSVALSKDPTVAFPATWPTDTGVFETRWYSAYLNYSVPTAPAAPSGASATWLTDLSEDVRIGWTDNATDETGYRVERAPDSALTGTVSVVGDSVSVALTGVGTLFTTELAVGTKVRIGSLAPVFEIATITDNLNATLTVAPATAQSGVAASKPGVYADVSGALAANAVSYDDPGALPATRYWWRAVAFNGGGDSAPSDPATLLLPTAPIATANHPTSGGTISEGIKVALEGVATPGTGAITSRQWSTDQPAGVLGTTDNLQVVPSGTDATPANHVLTYQVVDDQGFTRTDTTTLTVGNSGGSRFFKARAAVAALGGF